MTDRQVLLSSQNSPYDYVQSDYDTMAPWWQQRYVAVPEQMKICNLTSLNNCSYMMNMLGWLEIVWLFWQKSCTFKKCTKTSFKPGFGKRMAQMIQWNGVIDLTMKQCDWFISICKLLPKKTTCIEILHRLHSFQNSSIKLNQLNIHSWIEKTAYPAHRFQ